MNGLQASQSPPILADRWVLHERFEEQFMIALERNKVGGKRVAGKPVKDAPRIRTTIDVVTQRNGQAFGDRVLLKIESDLFNDLVQKVGAPVNITDYVQPTA